MSEALLHNISREGVLLKKRVMDLQISTNYYFEKLQKQPPTRIKNVGIDKLFDSYKLQSLNAAPIEQSIQLLQSCLQEGEAAGYRLEDGRNYKLSDVDSDDEEEYSDMANTLLANVTRYARQCGGDVGDAAQLNNIIQHLKECLDIVQQINKTYISIKTFLNTVKIGTLHELSKDVAKKNKLEPYDTATAFEFNKGGKRNRNTRKKRSHRRSRKITRRHRSSRK